MVARDVTDARHEEARALLALAEQAIAAYRRDDLAGTLAEARRRIEEPRCRVLVVGQYKTGKSSLVNALLNAPVCPVDVDIATAVPTIVTYAAQPTGRGIRVDGDEVTLVDVEPGEAQRLVTEDREGDDRFTAIEIGLPRRMLQAGLDLVDTPGVGGIGSLHQAATVAALPSADAVIFVSDAARELTGHELDFLDTVRGLCPTLACVTTKIDFYPDWRRIAAADELHLRSRGITAPLLPVSSTLRQVAIEQNDTGINEESGYGELVRWLQDVSSRSSELVLDAAVADLHALFGQLRAQLEAHRDALADPAAAERAAGELAAASSAAERLRSSTAGWQTRLNDGVTELSVEVDHDLRGRFRTMFRDAEERLKDVDPASAWPEFEAWLNGEVGQQVAANLELLNDQARRLAASVAELFETEASDIQVGGIDGPSAGITGPEFASRKLLNVGLTALRGSYGGMLMFGMLANLAGIALLGPVAPVLGLFLGRKAVREDRERQLAQRRQQGLQATRSYLDEVLAQVSKDSKASVRRLQRDLRDHFQQVATQVHATVKVALDNAQRASTDAGPERERKLQILENDLGRIDRYLERSAALLAPAPGGTT